jgi:trehalose/maltose transport system substrate-binding protein
MFEQQRGLRGRSDMSQRSRGSAMPGRVGLLGVAAALAALLGAAPAARAEHLAIACGSVGIEYKLCKEGAEAWAAKTGNQVQVVQTPPSATDRLALFQQLLAAGSPDVDVFQVDVIWPGILGRYLLDLRRYVDAATIAAHFPAQVENNIVGGELKALPWFADVGLLYYRKDLLEKYGLAVPTRWSDLAAAARTVTEGERKAGDAALAGFVFQGKAYEGLTCNALEWIASAGGGAILDGNGKVTLDNPKAVAALEMAAGWIGTIAGRGVLNYGEEEARGVFQSGHAVFMRNWPYAWALANAADSPVKGKVGIAPLPAGDAGTPSATLGGSGLAVSRFSRHPELAADLVRYLASPAEQARRAIAGAFNPTIPAVYEDPAVLRAMPVLAQLLPAVRAAVARPSRIAGDRYNQLSSIVWNAVHDTLSGRTPAGPSLAAAARSLDRLSRGGRW